MTAMAIRIFGEEGRKLVSWVFLSYSLGEAQALSPWGYKTLRLS